MYFSQPASSEISSVVTTFPFTFVHLRSIVGYSGIFVLKKLIDNTRRHINRISKEFHQFMVKSVQESTFLFVTRGAGYSRLYRDEVLY